MKKSLLGFAVLPLVFMLGGCSQSQYENALTNLSEVTDTYFYGKCDDFEVSISSGKREEPYSYDGNSQTKVDFALVVVKIDCDREKESFVFSINGEASSQMLEYNLMTRTYMVDLEQRLDSQCNISIKHGNTEISLECLSKDFAVDYQQALEIGVNEFSEDMTKITEKGEFKGECYLKVLDNLSNGYDTRFWCFSIVDTKGQHLNCIVDVETGEIVART